MARRKKSVTTTDVAREAGVSQSTVSMILNDYPFASFSEETKQKVYKACVTTGYRGIVKPSKGKDKMIIIVSPSCDNLDYAKSSSVIQMACKEKGFRSLTYFTMRDPELENSLPDIVQSLQVDGVLFLYQPQNPWLITKITNMKPVVSIVDRNPDITPDAIELSSEKIGKIISAHLISLGHKSIAYVAKAINEKYSVRANRLQGLKEGFREQGLDPEKSIVVCTYESEGVKGNPNDSDYETGYVLANYVVDKYDVTAIVGNNDAVSLGIIDALHYRKIKVPQDYSVCGCDNTYISGLKDISLTTVEKFTELRSREAVDILIKKIRQSSSDSSKYKLPISAIKVEYEPQIVARQSTGPSRKTK